MKAISGPSAVKVDGLIKGIKEIDHMMKGIKCVWMFTGRPRRKSMGGENWMDRLTCFVV